MPRPKSDLVEKHVNLYAGEYERLAELLPELTPGKVIRELVHDCIRRLEAGDPAMEDLTKGLGPVELAK